MSTPHEPIESKHDRERRNGISHGRPVLVGIPVRDGDIEPTARLSWVAKLFRVLAGMLIGLMVLQVVSGVTSTIEISYGVLLGEAVRLIIFAGLLWGCGDLADLFVKSHHDLRASRILLGRIAHLLSDREPGDGVH